MRISQTIPRFMFQPGPPGCASARLDARPGSGLEERGNKGMGERGGRKEGMLWRKERERRRVTPFERVHALSTLVKQPLKMVLLACMGRNDV